MGVSFATVLVFLIVAAGFVLVALVVGGLIRPKVRQGGLDATYECGEEPVGQAWYNFNPRFYIIALIFLIFDVEVVITVPVAVVFREFVSMHLGWVALVELLLFLAILLAGLVYLWGRGDLSWIKKIELTEPSSAQPKGPESASP